MTNSGKPRDDSGRSMKTDVLVIGAGASGLMCALEAGKRGRSVVVLEHTPRICAKVAISGGGKCNFTNRIVGWENYLSGNRRFPASALSRFTPQDFIAMLKNHGIGYEEREEGRLFCDRSSRAIVDMLRAECDEVSVEFVLNCEVSKPGKKVYFSVPTNRGVFTADSLVIATGGLTAPNLGSTNFGYAVARDFGLTVTPLKPALTPLKLGPEDRRRFSPLSGISIDAVVKHKKTAFRGNILFTHSGLSGPAILQISSYWDGRSDIAIDLLPDVDIHTEFNENRRSGAALSTFLDRYLPGRFVKLWLEADFKSKPLNRCSEKELASVAQKLHEWKVRPVAAEGFNKAEVTLGGVDTNELSSKTMESRKVPGLYFIGEVVDVTGQLGGYNLHWAWASGFAAGCCA